jgi:hypothetical protein
MGPKSTSKGVTRRTVLRGGITFAGALALGNRGIAGEPPPEERPTLVVWWLNGGPAGLFNSADSFLANAAFGVTSNNVLAVGNGLYVDAGSLGALPAGARAHMASINFRHGIVRPHDHARAAVLEVGPRSQLLRMAAAMPGGPLRCAVVNDLGLPVGVAFDRPAESGATLERVLDVAEAARRLQVQSRLDEVRVAYGVSTDGTAVQDQRSTFAAVELLVHGGASVIFAQPAYTGRRDRQFDTHDDDSGVQAREIMAPITPSLSTFLGRVLALPGRNVVSVLVGEFSRTNPKSDHERGGTATVIGKYVKTGTAGPQRPDGAPPADAPPPEGLWAYLSSALRVRGPFGPNPNPELIL